jgi:hypothetical protein
MFARSFPALEIGCKMRFSLADVSGRKFIVIAVGSIGFVSFFSAIGLFQYFATNSPTGLPIETGRVYQLNNHGHFFFVTAAEYWLFQILLYGGWALGAVAAALNYRWKVVRNLTKDGWRLPS